MAVPIETQGQVQDLLSLLRRRKWHILLPALIVASIGVFVAVVIPKKYVVSTELELREATLAGVGGATGDYVSSIVQGAPMAQFQLKATSRVQDVVRSLGWPDYLGLERDPERVAEMGKYLQNIQYDIRVSVPDIRKVDTTRFITIEYSDTDRAEQYLVALRDNWIDDVLRRDENRLRAERDSLKSDRNRLERLLEEERQALSQILKAHNLPPGQRYGADRTQREDPLYAGLVARKKELEDTRLRIESLTAQIAETMKQRDGLEAEIVTTFEDNVIDVRPRVTLIEGQIFELQLQQQRYTSLHPKWQKLQAEIDSKNEEISMLYTQESEGTIKEIRKANPEREAIQRDLDRLEAERAGLEGTLQRMERDIAESSRRLEILTDVFRQVATHEETIRRLEENLIATERLYLERESQYGMIQAGAVNPFTITRPPIKPTEASDPNPVLIVTMSIFLGLGLGLALALAIEFSRNCFRGIHDIARLLPVPILGVVNRITTRSEARRRLLARALMVFSTLVVAGSILFVTWAWYYRPGLLHPNLKVAIDGLRAAMI